MPWVRLDDNFYRHPKVRELTANAFRAWVSGLGYCSSLLTDGVISRAAFAEIGADPEIESELVNAGLWERHRNGKLIVHDYLEYQPSRARVDAARAGSRERVQRHRNGNVTPLHDRFMGRGCNAAETALARAISHPIPSHDQDPPVGPPSAVARASRRAEPKVRWRKVPGDWNPNPSHEALAQQLGVDYPHQLAQFRDHEFADPKSDADAAFRNWLRRAPDFKRNGKAPGLMEHETRELNESDLRAIARAKARWAAEQRREKGNGRT